MGVESGSQRCSMPWTRVCALRCRRRSREARRRRHPRLLLSAVWLPGRTLGGHSADDALVRNTRPDDIGVSFSYPLPGTAFFDRVQEQIGEASATGPTAMTCASCSRPATRTSFTVALRNALHAEVDWHGSASAPPIRRPANALLERVSSSSQRAETRQRAVYCRPETSQDGTQQRIPAARQDIRGARRS